MGNLFVPYAGNEPAPIIINGYRLLVFATERDAVEQHLEEFGGDTVRELSLTESQSDQDKVASDLAASVAAGHVIAPEETELVEFLKDLEGTLPWLH